MPTSNNLRPILHLKRWEAIASNPSIGGAGSFIVAADVTDPNQYVLYSNTGTIHWLYNPANDGWVRIASGVFSTSGAGSCGCWSPLGPSGTASAATSTTLTTTTTAAINLAGYTVRLTGGQGAGQERVIASNTIGANSVLTVATPWSVTPDATTTYSIRSGRYYLLNGIGTLSASTSFKYYDTATDSWSAGLSITNLPTTWGTDGSMISTHTRQFASGTATAGGASTLTDGAKTWAVNQWTNYQVRITSGAGAGQIRVIASNTATVLTVTIAWGTNPDSSSVYVIESNEDQIFLIGNNAVTMYKYSLSAATWSVVSPAVARAAAPTVGHSLVYVDQETDSVWTNESVILNGRYLYSSRGGSNSLDRFDLTTLSWSAVSYAHFNNTNTFAIGSSWTYIQNGIIGQESTTGRFYKYSPTKNTMDGWSFLPIAQGAGAAGNKLFPIRYTDGATKLTWIGVLLNTSGLFFRIMDI